MKAVIFALIVLLGIDLTVAQGKYVHAMGRGFAAATHEVGSWVYQQ